MAPDARVNLILKGELADAFRAEYQAEAARAIKAGERAPSFAEVARMLVQDGLRKRGHTAVEDGTGDWGGSRKESEEGQMAATA